MGLDQRITRRDFLNSTLLASGALLTDLSPAALLAQGGGQDALWNGPGGVGDYARSNGDTLAVLTDAHAIRDRAFETLPAKAIDRANSTTA